jgi:hypothetical protein
MIVKSSTRMPGEGRWDRRHGTDRSVNSMVIGRINISTGYDLDTWQSGI